jgi:hypothetical protein
MTASKAIKLRCKDCTLTKDRQSICIGCSLKDFSLTNLKKIKNYCKWCCNDTKPSSICSSPLCSLYLFKTGHKVSVE